MGYEITAVVLAILFMAGIIGSIKDGDFVTGVTTGSEVEATFGLLAVPVFLVGALAGFWTDHLVLASGLSVVLVMHSILLLDTMKATRVTSWVWDLILSLGFYVCAVGGLSTVLLREFGWLPAAILIIYCLGYAPLFKKNLVATKY